MLSIVCVFRMARCLHEPCDFHEALEKHGQHVKFIAELTSAMVRAECPLDIGILGWQLEMGAARPEVRARKLVRAPAIDSVAPLPACGHASECPRQQLSLRSTFPF